LTSDRIASAAASLAVAVVVLVVCWTECAFGRFGVGVGLLLSSGFLALGFGALSGALLGGLAGWASARRVRWLTLSALLGTAVFWRLAVDLRLIAIGYGVTHGQLRMVLAVCSLTAAVAVGVFSALAIGTKRSGRERALAAVALALCGLGACVADLLLPFDNYPVVHWVVRAETFAGVGGAVSLFVPRDLLASLDARRTAAAGVVSLGLSALLFGLTSPLGAVALLDQGLSRFVLENVRALSDWDGDGYSSLYGGGDCEPWNPAVNPGARDVPGNGIDENCRGGDARPWSPATPVTPTLTTTEAPPSIVLITAEALRIDHLGLYGYARDTTPGLTRWAKNAWRFDQAVSWTRTGMSMPSLFYGRLPARLRWARRVDTTSERLVAPEDLAPGELARRLLPAAIQQPFPSLPALLRQRGLRTFAVVDDGLSPYLTVQPGYAQDFERYETVRNNGGGLDDHDTATLAQHYLDELEGGGSFFLWVHFFGTHAPSTEHWALPTYGTDVAARYDHEIRYLDQQLTPLLARLDRLAKDRPLLVLFVADHGESFGRIERDHGLNVDEANIHVPLLLKQSGLGAGVSKSLVSQVDVMPTLLNAAGIGPSDLDGRDLREVIAHGEDPARIVLSAAWYWNFDSTPSCSMLAAVGDGRKATYDRLRNRRFVTRFGDFRETPLAPDASSERLFAAIDGYLDRYGPVVPR
jgi:arylsulfatase A-like enzyme